MDGREWYKRSKKWEPWYRKIGALNHEIIIRGVRFFFQIF